MGWVKACLAHLDGAPERAPHHACQQSFDGGHGRMEVRRMHALAADGLSAWDDWRGLNSLVRVHPERHLGERLTRETHYHLCNLPAPEVRRARS